MNIAYQGRWPQLAEADALLMDVARRIQLTKTKHEAAERKRDEFPPPHGLPQAEDFTP